MIEYTPFWFKLEKVEIVKSNSSTEVMLCKDSASLKNDPPPIC
jgi:hypothetical protein